MIRIHMQTHSPSIFLKWSFDLSPAPQNKLELAQSEAPVKARNSLHEKRCTEAETSVDDVTRLIVAHWTLFCTPAWLKLP